MFFLIAVEIALIIAAGYSAYRLWAQNSLIEQHKGKNMELRKEAKDAREEAAWAVYGLRGQVQELKLEAEDQRHNEMLYGRKDEANIHKWYRDKLKKIADSFADQ